MNTLHLHLVKQVLWRGKEWQGVWRCVCRKWKYMLKERKVFIITYAVSVPLLQWARANGCPWNEITSAYVAKYGHLNVLQWARVNGCPWDTRIGTQAARGS